MDLYEYFKSGIHPIYEVNQLESSLKKEGVKLIDLLKSGNIVNWVVMLFDRLIHFHCLITLLIVFRRCVKLNGEFNLW